VVVVAFGVGDFDGDFDGAGLADGDVLVATNVVA
jgi:hypothetical protein